MSEVVARIASLVAAGLPPPPLPEASRWAKPFVWRDPAEIPPRKWVLRPHLIGGFVCVTIAHGGVGKSTLTLCEALVQVSGRALLGVLPSQRTKVWCWNGEDPAEEIERRVHAAALHHRIQPAELEGWLFLGSGRDADLIIAEQDRSGATIATPVVEALIEFIRDQDIGAVVIDPFVSSHRVSENDNGAIDRVVKAWGRVAQATGCAIDLVHHSRKTNGGDVSVEDGRGASALLAAARYARTLRRMTEEEADRLGVERLDRAAYVRIDGGKANLSPLASDAVWFRLANVLLPNGDHVQAASPWAPPDPFDAVSPADLLRVQKAINAGRGPKGEGWRENVQTGPAWVGHVIAQALGLDVGRPREAARVRALLRTWIASGDLVKVDCTINPKGKTAPFVEVGRWVEP